MAIPNCTYLKLKMPGPKGVITVSSSYEHTYECDVECVEYGEAVKSSTELASKLEALAAEAPKPKRHAGSFEPAEGTKKIPLNPNGSDGKGLLFISPLGVHTRYVIRIYFAASNNVAEYEAHVNGLKIAIELGVRRLDVRGDSQLVIDQVMKASNCHDPKMEAYYKEVRRLEDKFHGLELVHIARRHNEAANELAKIAST